MAKVAINLNEKLPPEEDDTFNPAETLTIGSSDPSPATGTATDHAVDTLSEPPSAHSDDSSIMARKEGEEAKDTVAVIGSLAANSSNSQVDEIQRKIRRAERFGVPLQLSEAEKRNSRAERFGTGSGTKKPDGLNKSEEMKRKARAERFGIPVSDAKNEEERKRARLARFASNDKTVSNEEEKRKARAMRFSNISSPIQQVNNKAAVAGGASGRA